MTDSSIQNNTSNINTLLTADTSLADKSLIIFDWDGTLMDSIGLIVESMRQAGQLQGYQADDAAIKNVIGLSVLKGFEQAYPEASSEAHQSMVQSYNDIYIEASSSSDHTHAQFFAGIEPMLQQLKASGKLLAVATGKSREGLDKLMAVSNSEHYFSSTRCADEAGSKPDPKMLNDILDQTQKQVEDAVFIGDSVHDINMANAIGMMSIAVNYGAGTKEDLTQCNPTYQVDTPQQLVDLLTSSLMPSS